PNERQRGLRRNRRYLGRRELQTRLSGSKKCNQCLENRLGVSRPECAWLRHSSRRARRTSSGPESVHPLRPCPAIWSGLRATVLNSRFCKKLRTFAGTEREASAHL